MILKTENFNMFIPIINNCLPFKVYDYLSNLYQSFAITYSKNIIKGKNFLLLRS